MAIREITLRAEIVFSYVHPTNADAEPIPKAAFVDASDALVFWNALPDARKRHIRPFTADGEPIALFTHIGADRWGYSHADAMTAPRAKRWFPDRSKYEGAPPNRRREFIDVEVMEVKP